METSVLSIASIRTEDVHLIHDGVEHDGLELGVSAGGEENSQAAKTLVSMGRHDCG